MARRRAVKWIFLAAAVGLSAVLFLSFSGNEIKPAAHYYGKPETNVAAVDVFAFYAVPSNREAFDFSTVSENLSLTLGEAANFHNVQFGEMSKMNFHVFQKPVALLKSNLDYDTSSTAHGNPEALKGVTLELEARVFSEGGDLYDPDFVGLSEYGAFRVIAIIYEGVGAAGTEGSLILSRDFITKPEYALFRSSLFYHEFGHTLGIPEGYDIETNNPYTNDIMGSGRREPLSNNYIDSSTLSEMGVISK